MNEERYRLLVDLSPEGIFVHRDDVIEFVNPSGLSMLGAKSADEIVGRSLLEFIHPDKQKSYRESVIRLLAEGNVRNEEDPLKQASEHLLYKLNGDKIDVELISSTFEDNGHIFIHTVIRDISERKQLDQMLNHIAAGVTSFTGKKFYHFLVGYLAETLNVDFVYLGERATIRRTHAVIKAGWKNGDFTDETEFRLEGTPEQTVIGKRTRVYEDNILEFFPRYKFLAQNNIRAFIGVPLFGLENNFEGYLAVFSRDVFQNPGKVTSVLKIFAARTAAEMERFHVQAERKAQLETFSLLEEAVVEMDQEMNILNVSRPWSRLMRGADENSPIGRSFETWIHSDYRYFFWENIQSLLREIKAKVIIQFPVPIPDHPNRWLEGKFIPVREETHGTEPAVVKGVRGILRDVTMAHLSEKQFNFFAYHDNLTGLPNRNRMEENLYRYMNRTDTNSGLLAIGFIDMDNFSQINNVMGHKMGDRILIYMSERMQAILGSGEKLYRWGGDKFVVILQDMGDLETVRKAGKMLLGACRLPIDLDDQPVHASYSVGFATYPVDGLTADELMGEADRAVSHAKSLGKNNCMLASDIKDKDHHKEQLKLRNQIAMAIEQDEFRPYFQPKVKSGAHKIVGMEALARWPDNKGGFYENPITFIPMLENMGLIGALGEQILRHSLKFLRRLKEQNYYLNLSLNISRRQLFHADFEERLLRLLGEYNVNPFEITLEITESTAILDMDTVVRKLNSLRQDGFVFSIDDFGTGYSSLSQLHQMPVSELKVDMSFVRRLHTSEGAKMVEAISNMGTALNLTMVAEGVEDLATVTKLEEMGIHLFQGYYFGKPMDEEDFLKQLKTSEEKNPEEAPPENS